MNAIVVLSVFLVVFFGIYFTKINKPFYQRSIHLKTEAASQEKNEQVDQHRKREETKQVLSTEDKAVTQTPKSNLTQNELLNYLYPNSSIINFSSNFILLNSSDSAESVTDWYKNVIKDSDMNIRTFVTTSANKKVLNKLVGTNSNKEIRVEVSQEQNNSFVKISVRLENP